MCKLYHRLTTSNPGTRVQSVTAVARSSDPGSGEGPLAPQPPGPRREVLERREWCLSRPERRSAGGSGPECQQVGFRNYKAEPGDHAGTMDIPQLQYSHRLPFSLRYCQVLRISPFLFSAFLFTYLLFSLLFCFLLFSLLSSPLSPPLFSDSKRGHWQFAGRSWHPGHTWNGADVSLWGHW